MPSINPDFRNEQSNPKTDHAGPNQYQQRTNPDFNNRTTAEQFAKEKAEAKSEDKKSNLFKYGAIGAGITATLFLFKRKFLALIAAAATGAFVYFNQSTATKPQASTQQSHPDIHQEQTINQPSAEESLKLDRVKQYINDSKIETTSKSFLNQVIESTRSKLNSTNKLNKAIINQAMRESGFEQNTGALKKDISKLMHPDRIKQSDLSDLSELTMMIFQVPHDIVAEAEAKAKAEAAAKK
ncbi:MAG: hypothetical protein HOA17_08785 [Candidatus Melainabacteria bacterium]|nr:hypothetical protein [Candidatus Melainabacteria bacterium]